MSFEQRQRIRAARSDARLALVKRGKQARRLSVDADGARTADWL